MECPYCKTENRDGVRYCGSCGKLISPMTSMTTEGELGGTGTTNTIMPRSLVPGARLQGGRYVIKKVLGQGGMGAALLATDIRLDGKLVVIKELISDNTDPARLQDDVRNFKREMALLAHIDHPLVPNVTDHFQEDSTRYFMVQDYVEGENLEERMERVRQPMMEREALICASDILDVLDYLAKQTPPIVHRDIKPANIIIGSKDKRAHLVDFGIARADVIKNAQRKQTSALGTPGYAPPEQYQGNADPRSDLYALAATLHHLLTNRDPRNYPPFTYPLARSLNPQLSAEVERVLARALNNDVNQRYQSALAMKQDVDEILHKRFGVSGAINMYNLGNPGPIGTVNTAPPGRMGHPTINIDPTSTMAAGGSTVTTSGFNGANLPTVQSQGTPSQLSPMQQWPYTPSQPINQLPTSTFNAGNPPSYPYPPMPIPLPQQPLQRQTPPPQQPPQKRRAPWLFPVLILLVLLLIGGAVATTLLLSKKTPTSTPTPTPSISNGIGITKVGANEYIGISDGGYTLDTGTDRADASYKQQAASAFLHNPNDISTAISLYTQAISVDSNDAEAHIYQEDLSVISSGSPYVTVVVGTMLSGDASAVGTGRDDLQGAYIAQKEFNDGAKLGNLKVRVLIASSGSQANYAKTIANQIVQLAQSDKTFMGVMGWPYSSRSLDAVGVLNAHHIPMVSQTSSSDALTSSSPYFFRVVPANKVQGIAGARYAESALHTSRAALFFDPQDSYSQSLANDFKTQFTQDGQQIAVEEQYTVGKTGTLQARLTDAMSHTPDIIYFAGYSSDVSTLLTDLPSSAGNIPVLGGDALYQLNGYTTSARGNFTHLRFTAFAYPDEWGVQQLQEPNFFAQYPAAFDPNRQHKVNPYGYIRPDNDAILSYDAMTALLTGCSNALSGGKQTITSETLRQGLMQIQGTGAIQGVSGQIAFGPNGDPVNKAIVILAVDSNGFIKMVPPVLNTFLK